MPQLVTIFNVISVFLYAVIDVIVKYMVNCYQEASTSCYLYQQWVRRANSRIHICTESSYNLIFASLF